ncbi:MAG: hypothetical protein E7241_07860 [Lachnospiraceae bacterium]|jgi:hypothetical protein|nr:hypothetical protein [Lachnospiraceae bacterium]
MTVLEINDVKGFMAKLLASDTFDDYYILEAVITKANTFTIDGRLNEEYLADAGEDVTDLTAFRFQAWGKVRSLCFDLVKGKTLPIFMKVVLQLPESKVADILAESGASIRPEEITGLYLNITYDRKELRVVTGTSLKTFSMDKSLEREWDEAAGKIMAEYM